MKWFSRLFSTQKRQKVHYKDMLFEESVSDRGVYQLKLADVEQTIGGVRQLTITSIDEMVERKHDIDYQMKLCRDMIEKGDILPFPFERTVILLRKQKRYREELDICLYVKSYCENSKQSWDGGSAKIWKSPKLEKCIGRIDTLKGLVGKQQ